MAAPGRAMTTTDDPGLVLGGTGTVGRRLVCRLRGSGVPVRPAGRHSDPPLDWTDPAAWHRPLAGVRRIYLLLPDATDLPAGFLVRAAAAGAPAARPVGLPDGGRDG